MVIVPELTNEKELKAKTTKLKDLLRKNTSKSNASILKKRINTFELFLRDLEKC